MYSRFVQATVAPIDDFASFYRRTHADTVRLLYLLSGDRSEAEDLAQSAYVKLARQFDGARSPDALLRVVAINLLRNEFRRRDRERSRTRALARPDAYVEAPFSDFATVLRALPARQRQVIVCRYWLGLSEKEIACLVGCRVGTVKSAHSRAMGTLRQVVEPGD